MTLQQITDHLVFKFIAQLLSLPEKRTNCNLTEAGIGMFCLYSYRGVPPNYTALSKFPLLHIFGTSCSFTIKKKEPRLDGFLARFFDRWYEIKNASKKIKAK